RKEDLLALKHRHHLSAVMARASGPSSNHKSQKYGSLLTSTWIYSTLVLRSLAPRARRLEGRPGWTRFPLWPSFETHSRARAGAPQDEVRRCSLALRWQPSRQSAR